MWAHLRTAAAHLATQALHASVASAGPVSRCPQECYRQIKLSLLGLGSFGFRASSQIE